MADIKYMDIREFQTEGFLQEVNRQFFHPHGLALEVIIDSDGTYRLAGIWDYRDDPEGVIFSQHALSPRKRDSVAAERERHVEARIAILGDVVQSVEEP